LPEGEKKKEAVGGTVEGGGGGFKEIKDLGITT